MRALFLTRGFIADTHFVVNVTSSLLLAVKPIVRILMPSEEPDVLQDGQRSAPGTAPLAHLLQGLRCLKQEKLQEFKLLIRDAAARQTGSYI